MYEYEDVIRIVNSAHETRLAQKEERRRLMRQNAVKRIAIRILYGVIFGASAIGVILGMDRILRGFPVDAVARWFIPSLIALSMFTGALAQKYVL